MYKCFSIQFHPKKKQPVTYIKVKSLANEGGAYRGHGWGQRSRLDGHEGVITQEGVVQEVTVFITMVEVVVDTVTTRHVDA